MVTQTTPSPSKKECSWCKMQTIVVIKTKLHFTVPLSRMFYWRNIRQNIYNNVWGNSSVWGKYWEEIKNIVKVFYFHQGSKKAREMVKFHHFTLLLSAVLKLTWMCTLEDGGVASTVIFLNNCKSLKFQKNYKTAKYKRKIQE